MFEIKRLQPILARTRLSGGHDLKRASGVAIRSREMTTSPRKLAFAMAGYFFVGLAGLGALLPVLPTTPFLILASACFMRSSPEMRQWLLRLPVWGAMLQDWETRRAVKPQTKRVAFGVMASAVVVTILLGRLSLPLLLLFLALVSIGSFTIWRLPVIEPSNFSPNPHQRREEISRMRLRRTTGRK